MRLPLRILAPVLLAIGLLFLMTDNTDLSSARDTRLSIPPVSSIADSDLRTPPIRPYPPTAAPTSASAPRATTSTPVSDESPTRQDQIEIKRQLTKEAATASAETLDLYVHLPPDATLKQPLRILVALHGVGARGDIFAQRLIADADRNGWVVIAPTISYRDHMNPQILLDEDIRYSRLLENTLATLPRRLGIKLRHHVLVYGFSRGAQLAHRFALFYPARVETVAAFSAGSYTLPLDQRARASSAQAMPLPFGISDYQQRIGYAFDSKQFKKISFWLAVGQKDDIVQEVPRAFDQYVGEDRVKRATMFYQTLLELGMDAHIVVYPGAGHELSLDMQKSALKFMRDDELEDKLND